MGDVQGSEQDGARAKSKDSLTWEINSPVSIGDLGADAPPAAEIEIYQK